MAAVNVYIPTPLRRLSRGAAHVPIEVAPGETTLAELVDRIEQIYPGLKREIWENDDFRHHVNVYVNGDEVRGLAGKSTHLADGDQVAFVPMLAGGDAFALSAHHREEMIRHAVEEMPNECCGVIMQRDGEPPMLERLVNADASPFSYAVRSEDLFALFRRTENGEQMAAIYHSHTHTKAYPSQTDVRMAGYPDSVYLIVSLADRANPSVRGFRILEGGITEVEVVAR